MSVCLSNIFYKAEFSYELTKKTKTWLSEKTNSKHSLTVFMSAHYISSRVCVFPVPVEMILLAGDNRWRGRWLCLSWKLWERHKLLICNFTLTFAIGGETKTRKVYDAKVLKKKKHSQTDLTASLEAVHPPPRDVSQYFPISFCLLFKLCKQRTMAFKESAAIGCEMKIGRLQQ